MKLISTIIQGLYVIEPRVWRDERGYFFESFSRKFFEEAGIEADFVQDNQSLSQKGTLRGLHAQAPPSAQGKLVRVSKGSVMDVALDIRKDSSTYGQYVAYELNDENHRMLWIPPGFLHGFVTLTDNTIFTYKVTSLYDKDSEIGVVWNDPELGIDWGIEKSGIIISEKDKALPSFADFKSPF